MYKSTNPLILVLAYTCILAGFFLPFLGYWNNDTFTLHSLALAGFIIGVAGGKGAAILRDNR